MGALLYTLDISWATPVKSWVRQLTDSVHEMIRLFEIEAVRHGLRVPESEMM